MIHPRSSVDPPSEVESPDYYIVMGITMPSCYARTGTAVVALLLVLVLLHLWTSVKRDKQRVSTRHHVD